MDPFFYNLAIERIAQRPVHPPESAKMLCINRATGKLTDSFFSELPNLLGAKDLLVFNNTKVIPARIFAKLETGEDCEILLLRSGLNGVWTAMGRPMRQFLEGAKAVVNDSTRAVFGRRISPQEVEVHFENLASKEVIGQNEILSLGIMPIPPYIREGMADQSDEKDYQSIFAKISGSVAAPTASLHFSDSLIENIKRVGTRIEFVTLHVGAASFLSLKSDKKGKIMPPSAERFVYSAKLLFKLKETKERGGRVIAVGTTVVRAVETMSRLSTDHREGEELDTKLFLTPGEELVAIDSLITNFHQPGTTHLLLVEALLGREKLETCYNHAINSGYRFLSYGDGMFIQ